MSNSNTFLLGNEVNKTVLVSCPGKVLLVGGYLVLDPEYSGLVISTEARLYSWVVPAEVNEFFEKQSGKNNQVASFENSSVYDFTVKVQSSQFTNTPWCYTYKVLKDGSYQLEEKEEASGSKNRFVFCAVDAVFKFIHYSYSADSETRKKLSQPFNVYLLADNDFYSQREQLKKRGLALNMSSLAQLPKCNWIGGSIQTANKTGLGSSACLVSSLVGALLLHFLPNSSTPKSTYPYSELVHRLAQYAHCRAQGKIGSGFDVASAVFGSLSYRRFNPSVLADLLPTNDDDSLDGKVFSERMSVDNWDYKIEPASLPPRFHLVLGEVDAGSHTPTLVSKVLEWRRINPDEASRVWAELNYKNNSVQLALSKLTELYKSDPENYNLVLDSLLESSSIEEKSVTSSSTLDVINDLSEDFQSIRKMLRHLSESTGVPIEPSEQTALLNAIQSINGVIMAGVPGAGGHDAIFAIYVDYQTSDVNSSTILSKVQECFNLHSTSSTRVGPLLSKEDMHSGIIQEDFNSPCIHSVIHSVFSNFNL